MGNCKDCRHWFNQLDARGNSWTECGAVPWYDRQQEIEKDGFAIYAHASDDCGLGCGLKTGPMFGCTIFQKKDVD